MQFLKEIFVCIPGGQRTSAFFSFSYVSPWDQTPDLETRAFACRALSVALISLLVIRLHQANLNILIREINTLVFRVIFTFKGSSLLLYYAIRCWFCVTSFSFIACLGGFWFFFSLSSASSQFDWVLQSCVFSRLILSSFASRSKATLPGCSGWLVW